MRMMPGIKLRPVLHLLQTYTGWAYEGPTMVRSVLKGLLTKLDEHGLSAIADAVGKAHKPKNIG